jgi:hypothetical protein
MDGGSATSMQVSHKTQVLHVRPGEAMAILEVMREAISRGWTNIVFESDFKIVMDAIHANTQGISELCSIISLIKSSLCCNSNFEIKFTKWQVNMTAHTLTRTVNTWFSR